MVPKIGATLVRKKLCKKYLKQGDYNKDQSTSLHEDLISSPSYQQSVVLAKASMQTCWFKHTKIK